MGRHPGHPFQKLLSLCSVPRIPQKSWKMRNSALCHPGSYGIREVGSTL